MYALIDQRPARRELLGRGMRRKPLSLVRAGKTYVVVEQGDSCEATAPALVAHDRVVRRLSRLLPAVLPLRFGTVADGPEAIRALIAPLAEPLERAFERVRGAVQFTLRVSGLPASPPPLDPRLGPGARWLAGRAARYTVPELASVTNATRPFVRALRVERRDDPPGLADVYQLVARDDVRRWRAAFRRSLLALPSGIRVTMTGPWPAWSFAELT
nr:GvpL/GvpF family gas vesicle protein [Labilithrix luteola]